MLLNPGMQACLNAGFKNLSRKWDTVLEVTFYVPAHHIGIQFDIGFDGTC